jgi:hypothetical protein
MSQLLMAINARNCTTLHDGQEDDNDEEEEGDVIEHPGIFQLIAIGRLQLIPNATTRPDTSVEMVDEAGKHVMAFSIRLAALLLLQKINKKLL